MIFTWRIFIYTLMCTRYVELVHLLKSSILVHSHLISPVNFSLDLSWEVIHSSLLQELHLSEDVKDRTSTFRINKKYVSSSTLIENHMLISSDHYSSLMIVSLSSLIHSFTSSWSTCTSSLQRPSHEWVTLVEYLHIQNHWSFNVELYQSSSTDHDIKDSHTQVIIDSSWLWWLTECFMIEEMLSHIEGSFQVSLLLQTRVQYTFQNQSINASSVLSYLWRELKQHFIDQCHHRWSCNACWKGTQIASKGLAQHLLEEVNDEKRLSRMC